LKKEIDMKLIKYLAKQSECAYIFYFYFRFVKMEHALSAWNEKRKKFCAICNSLIFKDVRVLKNRVVQEFR
jgi:hypothetical protein